MSTCHKSLLCLEEEAEPLTLLSIGFYKAGHRFARILAHFSLRPFPVCTHQLQMADMKIHYEGGLRFIGPL